MCVCVCVTQSWSQSQYIYFSESVSEWVSEPDGATEWVSEWGRGISHYQCMPILTGHLHNQHRHLSHAGTFGLPTLWKIYGTPGRGSSGHFLTLCPWGKFAPEPGAVECLPCRECDTNSQLGSLTADVTCMHCHGHSHWICLATESGWKGACPAKLNDTIQKMVTRPLSRASLGYLVPSVFPTLCV